MINFRSVEFGKPLYQTDNDLAPNTLKCLIVGEPMVGKTCTLNTLDNEIFDGQTQPTIGIDVKIIYGTLTDHTAPINQQTLYRLQVWDCAGQIRFKNIVASYFRMAQIIIFMFDITDRASFYTIKEWHEAVKEKMPNDLYVSFLIGNKIDAEKRRTVMKDEALELAQKLNMKGYFEVSARKGTNIQPTFEAIIIETHDAIKRNQIQFPSQPTKIVDLQTSSGNLFDCLPFANAKQCNIS